MKYYWLTNNIDPKIVGRYDQSESAHNAPKFWEHIENGEINEGMTIPEPILHSKANLTSYLSSVPINRLLFLILKKEFVEFLKDFNVSSFQTWNMKVHYRNKIITNYCLFYLSHPSQKKYVDYRNSEFYIGNIKDYKWVGEEINISDYENFLSIREDLRSQRLMLKAKKFVFNFSEATEDLIRITDAPPVVGSKGYYVSEKLKSAIEVEGFTGMTFKEIEEIDNERRIQVIYQ